MLIIAWISNYFSILNGAAVEVFEWISNFIPQLIGHVITYLCWDLSQTMALEGVTDDKHNMVYVISIEQFNQWSAVGLRDDLFN